MGAEYTPARTPSVRHCTDGVRAAPSYAAALNRAPGAAQDPISEDETRSDLMNILNWLGGGGLIPDRPLQRCVASPAPLSRS